MYQGMSCKHGRRVHPNVSVFMLPSLPFCQLRGPQSRAGTKGRVGNKNGKGSGPGWGRTLGRALMLFSVAVLVSPLHSCPGLIVRLHPLLSGAKPFLPAFFPTRICSSPSCLNIVAHVSVWVGGWIRGEGMSPPSNNVFVTCVSGTSYYVFIHPFVLNVAAFGCAGGTSTTHPVPRRKKTALLTSWPPTCIPALQQLWSRKCSHFYEQISFLRPHYGMCRSLREQHISQRIPIAF